ncbi:MAG: hypothetical protein RLZZ435_1417, partial [Cyanobacteriota bacterium]
TKLDVLDDMDELKVCIAYDIDGERLENFPTSATRLQKCKPIYHTLPGWKTNTSHCRTLEDLPTPALEYLKYLAGLMEVPIAIVSVGPKRDQTIIVEDPIHGPKRGLLANAGGLE